MHTTQFLSIYFNLHDIKGNLKSSNLFKFPVSYHLWSWTFTRRDPKPIWTFFRHKPSSIRLPKAWSGYLLEHIPWDPSVFPHWLTGFLGRAEEPFACSAKSWHAATGEVSLANSWQPCRLSELTGCVITTCCKAVPTHKDTTQLQKFPEISRKSIDVCINEQSDSSCSMELLCANCQAGWGWYREPSCWVPAQREPLLHEKGAGPVLRRITRTGWQGAGHSTFLPLPASLCQSHWSRCVFENRLTW